VQLHLLNPGDPGPTEEPDLVVVVDTGAWSQLEPMRPYLQARHDKTIVIDHHLRGDEVGRWQWIDTTAAAACEIIADLVELLPVEPDALIHDALFVGIASDTGWFRFSNTSPRTHELAARLQRAGVDHAMLYQQVEQGERPEKLALLIRALDSLKLLNGGTAAVMCLRISDFDETGARPEETERFVDIPQIVRDVDVVALITEQQEGPVRVSFRSKPGDDAIDVSALAGQFGGGGHARASGAKIDGSLETVQRQVIQAIEQHLAQAGSS
jgi:phosphoesterase RecJ-like protein